MNAEARPLSGGAFDYDPLVEFAGEKRRVLLGEASHGTHDFYRQRAEITKRLIKEKGFTAVAVEADWPDAYRVNRYVRGESGDADAVEALESLFHDVAIPRFLLMLPEESRAAGALSEPRLERAIGVIYRPESERLSHYFHARMPRQFDAVLHFDETRAVEPLERNTEWAPAEVPETFPSAL